MAGENGNAAQAALKAVGKVDKLTGKVEVIHPDGTRSVLHAGDIVYQGDAVVTSSDGTVGIVFLDASTFSLGKSGSMTIDELVYDPDAQTGHSALSVLKGTFAAASGHIAKTGPDAATLKTPVMTIGIRGTTVAGIASAEGEENMVSLLQDADGGTGQIVITNAAGSVVLNTANNTVQMFSAFQPPPPPVLLPPQAIQQMYDSARSSLPPPPSHPLSPQDLTPPPPALQPAPNPQPQDQPHPQNQGTGNTGGDEVVHFIPTTLPVDTPVPPQPIGTVGPELPISFDKPWPGAHPEPRPVEPIRNDPVPPDDDNTNNDTPNQQPELSGVGVGVTYQNSTTPITGNINAIDPEAGSVTLDVPCISAHGGIVTFDAATGEWSYLPPPDFHGIDTVTVSATDADGATSTFTVNLYVNETPGAAPSVTQANTAQVDAEPSTWTPLHDYQLAVSDDSTYLQLTVTIHPGSDDHSGTGRMFINGAWTEFSGTLSLAGTTNDVQSWLASLQYKGNGGEFDSVSVEVNDGAATGFASFDVSTLTSGYTDTHFVASSGAFGTSAYWDAGIPDSNSNAIISSGTATLVGSTPAGVTGRLTLSGGNFAATGATLYADYVTVGTGSSLTLLNSSAYLGYSAALSGGTLNIVASDVLGNDGLGPQYEYYQFSGATTFAAVGTNSNTYQFAPEFEAFGGTVTLNANNGDLSLEFINPVWNYSGSTVVLTSDADNYDLSAQFDAGLVNAGTMTIGGTGSGTYTLSTTGGAEIENLGVITVSHDVSISNLTNAPAGTIDIEAGATLSAPGGVIGGELIGDGTLHVGYGEGIALGLYGASGFSAMIRPGGNDSIGHLTFAFDGGSYATFENSCAIEIEHASVGGSLGHDLLTFEGSAIPALSNANLILDIDTLLGAMGPVTDTIIENVSMMLSFNSVSLDSHSNTHAVTGLWIDEVSGGTFDLKEKTAIFNDGETATYTAGSLSETIFGATGLNNEITGSTDNDIITGGNCDDTISSGGGSDDISGGGGNDTIRLNSSAYGFIDGGAGLDVLDYASSSITPLTLSTSPSSGVSGIEVLRISAPGGLNLSQSAIWNMTDTISDDAGVNSLYVIGNGNTLHFTSGTWHHDTSVTNADMDHDGTTESYQYYYSNMDAHLYVSTDTNVALP